MLDAVKHGLSHLVRFDGRDGRQAFWFFVLFLYLVTMALSLVFVMPLMMGAMANGIQQTIAQSASSDPETARASAQAAMAGAMAPVMPVMMWVGVASSLIMLLGLAAALVRRLHDSGMSGWWAAAPGALQALGLAMLPRQFAQVQAAIGSVDSSDPLAGYRMMQGTAGLAALPGWLAIALVIWFGVRKSAEGANRYGKTAFNV